jgi:hypothetical protein
MFVGMTELSPEQAEQLRARVRGWKAAEVRERDLRRSEGAMTSADAFRAAMELCELASEAYDAPDPVRDREIERTRLIWQRLRDGAR